MHGPTLDTFVTLHVHVHMYMCMLYSECLLITIESDDSTEVIFAVFALALSGQSLDGQGRVSGEGAQTREKVSG